MTFTPISPLTTGIDNIAPAGNSTINGVIGTNSTFNALDSIKATGTNNTLNIADQTTTATSTFPMVTVTGVQTVNIQSTSAPQLDTSGWTGLTALNIAASTGADKITAASTAATTVTDTLATENSASGTLTAPTVSATTIDGGTTVNLTATGSVTVVSTSTTPGTTGDGGAIGNITVGGTTAPTGNVTITATETASDSNATATAGLNAATAQFGNITATSGAGVTITSTENVGNFAAFNNATGTTAATVTYVNAGAISATGGSTGAVIVTSNVNMNDTAIAAAPSNAATGPQNDTFVGGAVTAKGGSTITVTETATASAAALAANPGAAGVAGTKTLTVTQGNVTALDGGSATSVTINQAAPATAVGATGAVTAAAGSTTAGGPGYSAVTTAGSAAAALVPATLGVVAGAVTVAGASAGNALANASSTITTVSLNNYGNSTINSSALTTLTLAGSGGTLLIDNVGNTAITSLTVNANALTGGAITESTDGSGGTTGSGKIKTLSVVTGGASGSTISALTNFSALTTLNVSGTQVLTFTSTPGTLTTVGITGSAGLNADISGYLTAAAPAITDTSSGAVTLKMDADSTHQQTFVGSTGRDVITIASDATKAITGGSATNNELVLNANATTFASGTGHTWANVTGFSTLGLGASSQGAYNLGAMGTNVFNAIDVKAAPAAAASFTNVAHNASLSIDASITGFTGALNYQSADATGATDVVTVNLGTTAGGNVTVGNAAGDDGSTVAKSSLTMQDANGVGIGTLNIVSNDTSTGAAASNVNTIVALADSGLSNLNVSGVDGLTINILNEGITSGATATAATSFTINNTSGGTVTIGAMTDSALGSLTFTGSGNDVITALYNGTTSHALSISNTGTGTATITTLEGAATPTGNALTSLTLGAGVTLGPDAAALTNYTTQGLVDAATTGVTVSGSADNAHVVLNLTSGAASGNTDSITLGNGNDYINDASTAGTVNVTVGTGSNLMVLGGTNTDTTGAYNVTLGAHTGVDKIVIGSINYAVPATGTAVTYPSAPNLVVTGSAKGDVFTLANDTGSTITVASTATTAGSTVAATISSLETAAAATLHSIQYSVFGGNTYAVEASAANTAQGTSATTASNYTIIELVGTHTFTGGASGVVTLAS